MALFGLALHIANPTEPKPDPIAFDTSPDGKAFIATSSEARAEAATAARTKPTAAQASATQVTASYTGELGVASSDMTAHR